jgi:hypothetical protein
MFEFEKIGKILIIKVNHLSTYYEYNDFKILLYLVIKNHKIDIN